MAFVIPLAAMFTIEELVAVGVLAGGILFAAKHTKNKSKVRWDKHSKRRSGFLKEKKRLQRRCKKKETETKRRER